MKLEMKKIVLIMAAGILAFSGAFGAITSGADKDLATIKVINDLADYKVTVTLKGTSETGATLPSTITVDGKRSESIPFSPATSNMNEVDFKVEKTGGVTGLGSRTATVAATSDEKNINLDVKFDKNERTPAQIQAKLERELARKLSGQGPVKITAKVEGDTLVFTASRALLDSAPAATSAL